MSNLLRVTRGRLLNMVSTLSIQDKVVLDRFLRALPHDMKRAASLCVPQTLEGLLEAMENTEHSGPLLSGSRAESVTCSRSRKDNPLLCIPNRQSTGPKDSKLFCPTVCQDSRRVADYAVDFARWRLRVPEHGSIVRHVTSQIIGGDQRGACSPGAAHRP
jgi:hypothetical protein